MTSIWVPECVAREQLTLKKSTLRTMRREKRLRPGIDWIYSTGTKNSPVLYNLPAIFENLSGITIALADDEALKQTSLLQKRLDAVESYSEMDDESTQRREG